jgi:hypothetical protein
MAFPLLPIIGAGLNFVGKLIGGKQEQVTRNEVDYVKLRDSAEKAGFNPLTALRAGGAAGFSVTHHPALSAANVFGDAVSGFGGFLMDYDAGAEKRAQAEYDLLQAQIGLVNAQSAQIGSFNVPSARAGRVVDGNGRPTGEALTPTIEQPSFTNPWTASKIDPDVYDAENFEARYGDIGSNVLGIYVGARDLIYNTWDQINVRELSESEKAEREKSWVPSWVPTFRFER